MRDFHQVQRFCIKKLAKILSECVACSHEDRQLLDWLTAERFVKAHGNAVDMIGDRFDEMSIRIEDPNFETFDWLCGRLVWDWLYQPWKKELGLPNRPVPHYTYITFG